MVFYGSSWQGYPDTDRNAGAYIVFNKGGPIDHCTHVPVPFAQYSVESEYDQACTAWMALAYFNMLNNEFMNKDPDVVPKYSSLIILDRKLTVCMTNNGKYTKHTRYISREINFVRNGEEWNLHKIVWCEGYMKLEDIGTNNVEED